MSLAQLSRLLPLPEQELQQVLDYASTLSKNEAVDHFTNLLGDSPQAIEFLATFNSRRAEPKAKAAATSPQNDRGAVPKTQRKLSKKLPEDSGPASGQVHHEKPGRPDTSTSSLPPSGPSNAPGSQSATPPPKPRPPAAGTLVSDLGLRKQKPKTTSDPVSRSSTPAAGSRSRINVGQSSAKVSIVGGQAMHGASTTLTDFDDAIRSLELTTNTAHASNHVEARRCNCVAARHPLQAAAPNCLSCGKVVCLKEGLGPCTFCGTPLLTPAEVHSILRELRAERGQERMALDRERNKRAEVSTAPRPFSKPRTSVHLGDPDPAEARARDHRDKLLAFQAQNAKRTTVRDEAADFETSPVGNMWASPEERARQLKKQQKLLREMEWNAKPDYEKRQQVVSIDLVGGKAVKKMVAVERAPSPEEDEDKSADCAPAGANQEPGGGTFSRNPLLQGLLKPVYNGKGKSSTGRKPKTVQWRRVQDDLDDNEDVILDRGLNSGGSDCG